MRLTVEFEHGEEFRARTAAPALRIRKLAPGPPFRAPREHAGRHAATLVVKRREQSCGLVAIDDAHGPDRSGIVTKCEARTLGVDRPHPCRRPVAEATVDRRLRGPKDCERLAALVQVFELTPHQLRHDPATAMAREHADPRDPTGPKRSAGNGQLEWI